MAHKKTELRNDYFGRIRSIACPECDAAPGEWCSDERGKPAMRKTIHGVRTDAYRLLQRHPEPKPTMPLEFEVFARVREKTFESIYEMLCNPTLREQLTNKLDGEEKMEVKTAWVVEAVESALIQCQEKIKELCE